MKIAIYSRKSKFTGKGDSVENQIQSCKDYTYRNFDNVTEDDFTIYEDEGFSGGTIERPNFIKLTNDIKNRKIDTLLVYRLDRLGRKVADLANFFNLLETNNINFISITENYDTTTPLGKVMLNISSAFAQYERDIIAERIRDNFHNLAKTGRWLGGKPPIGYRKKTITNTDDTGKERKYSILELVPEEAEIIRLIYDKYMYFNSTMAVVNYLIDNNYKSKNNVYYSDNSIRNILRNPVYCIADSNSYDYFTSFGHEFNKELFDGVRGLYAFSRYTDKSASWSKLTPTENWLMSVGFHNGIISGQDFVKVQNMLSETKIFCKPATNKECPTILNNLVYCKGCGSKMRAKNGKILADGSQAFYYMCDKKERSGGRLCSIKNGIGKNLDKVVVDELSSLLLFSEDNLKSSLKKLKFANTKTIENKQTYLSELTSNLNDTNKQIDKITTFIATSEISDDIHSVMVEKLDLLIKERKSIDSKISIVSKEIKNLESATFPIDSVNATFKAFYNFDSLDLQAKRNLMATIIDKIYFDGKVAEITLFHGLSVSLNELVSH